MKVNKRGQEMSVATLVLIVIGIVVLVMLIMGFTLGWQNLWQKINIFGGGSNVETVVQACKLAAASEATYSYCSEFKEVEIGGNDVYVNCQSNQIDTSLTDKLSCPKPLEENAKEFCASLGESERASTRVVASHGVGEGTMKTCDVILGTADKKPAPMNSTNSS